MCWIKFEYDFCLLSLITIFYQTMELKIITTRDGSKSLFVPKMNETYHSKFGAKTESEHVFIRMGYQYINQASIDILEVGFGTGLNAFLTWREHLKDGRKIYYESLEKYPLSPDIIASINVFENPDEHAFFNRLHQTEWNMPIEVSPNFVLHKKQVDLRHYQTDKKFDLIYFDAFAPDKQPELWTEEIFRKMFGLLNKNGVLVTYSAKGSVRRTMQSVGFSVERLPGPPGKREMLRAIKK